MPPGGPPPTSATDPNDPNALYSQKGHFTTLGGKFAGNFIYSIAGFDF